MRVIDPGHAYKLNFLDGGPRILGQDELTFVKREGPKYPGNVGHYPGTNIQEVLRALINRVEYLNNQIPDKRNEIVLDSLRACLYLLEERAADRHGRQFFKIMMHDIELYPICPLCGHIGCKGDCHASSHR